MLQPVLIFAAAIVALSTPGTANAMSPDSLRIRLDVPEFVPAGTLLPVVLRLENRSARSLDLYLRGRTIAFDIIITGQNGEAVWQRLKDEIIPAIVQLKTLRPGETLELEHQWDQRDNEGEPVGPGSYTVRGMVLTDGPAPLETPSASLRIQPRSR